MTEFVDHLEEMVSCFSDPNGTVQLTSLKRVAESANGLVALEAKFDVDQVLAREASMLTEVFYRFLKCSPNDPDGHFLADASIQEMSFTTKTLPMLTFELLLVYETINT